MAGRLVLFACFFALRLSLAARSPEEGARFLVTRVGVVSI